MSTIVAYVDLTLDSDGEDAPAAPQDAVPCPCFTCRKKSVNGNSNIIDGAAMTNGEPLDLSVKRLVDQFNQREGRRKKRPVTVELPNGAKRNRAAEPGPSTSNEYERLVQLASLPLIPNESSFDCPICFVTIAPHTGIVLHDCLHSFCRSCAAETIRHAEEPDVKCPFVDAAGENACQQRFLDREIRALLPPTDYDRHLALSLRQAEARMRDTFHCPTPDCRGWCVVPEDVEPGRKFHCELCHAVACLSCRAEHESGETCEQFRARTAKNQEAIVQDQKELEQMLAEGKIIRCPGCQAYVQKTGGCDNVICAICRVEICWVTRKLRRGPNGCQCMEKGKRCHPRCQNCH